MGEIDAKFKLVVHASMLSVCVVGVSCLGVLLPKSRSHVYKNFRIIRLNNVANFIRGY